MDIVMVTHHPMKITRLTKDIRHKIHTHHHLKITAAQAPMTFTRELIDTR